MALFRQEKNRAVRQHFHSHKRVKKTPDKMYCCLVVSGNMMYNEKEEAECRRYLCFMELS